MIFIEKVAHLNLVRETGNRNEVSPIRFLFNTTQLSLVLNQRINSRMFLFGALLLSFGISVGYAFRSVAVTKETFARRTDKMATVARATEQSEMVGASIELNGGNVHDPLGLLNYHARSPGNMPHAKWLRESELKHCRIAMLASIGAFTGQWGLTIPGYTAVADPVENLNKFVLDYPMGFSQIIFAIGLIEGASYPGDFWFGKGDREAGDMGFDPLGLSKNKTPAQRKTRQLQELKNGRLAMMAMAGYACNHYIPGAVPFMPGNF